mmetsp:Transcript_6836/g.19107  ORF Transcript_6836/g.19107 Transcript_6836/m.19107 type:complete len:91 (+) Transcript_6836:127-399(+)
MIAAAVELNHSWIANPPKLGTASPYPAPVENTAKKAMPKNVPTASPRLPTMSPGTSRLGHFCACASATAVAGPPMAADDAINNRCGFMQG